MASLRPAVRSPLRSAIRSAVRVYGRAVPFVSDGDSNSQAWLGEPLPHPWPEYTRPLPIANNAVGNTRLVEGVNPLIDRIAGDLALSPEAIAITWGGNDIREYIGTDGLTTAQCISRMKEDLLTVSKLCIDAGVGLVISTLHQLGDAYEDAWIPNYGAPWTTNQVAVEGMIDDINDWVLLIEGPLTWLVADIRSILDDPTRSTGDRGMYPAMQHEGFGGHWNSSASVLIAGVFQEALSRVTAPNPQEFSFDGNGYIRVTGWQPNGAKATTVQFTSSQKDDSTNQNPFGTFTASVPQFALQYLAGANADANLFFPASIGNNPIVLTTRTEDVDYPHEITWPANTGNITIEIDPIRTLTSGTKRGTVNGTEDFIIGAQTVFSSYGSFWRGVVKDIRIYEDGYLVHDIAVNDGAGQILDRITGDYYTLTAGSGSWV